MKKRLIIIALFLAVAVVAAVVVKREFFPAPGVTVENFKRLSKSMTEHDFDAVLGEGGECRVVPQAVRPGQTPLSVFSKRWVGDDITITICFQDTSEGGVRSGFALIGNCQSAGGTRIELGSYQETVLDRSYWWIRGVTRFVGL